MGLLPEAYRQLSMQGKIGFSLFTILDVVVIILMFVSPAISPIDTVSLIFGIVYILQTLAWIILYLVLGRVCNIQMWGLPALASMIFYYFQTNQTTLTEIGVQFIWVRLFFIGMYPADWSVIIPGKFEKRMAEYGDKYYASAAAYAFPDTLHKNPKVPEKEKHWLQEYGDPKNPVIVCYSGMPCGNVGNGMNIFPFLLMDYFIVCIEHPGAGNGRGLKFSLDEIQRRTELYVKELQPRVNEPVLLYGVSGGANCAVYMASKLKNLAAGCCAVVGVSPGNPLAFTKGKSGWGNPLLFKTKTDWRWSPYMSIGNFLAAELKKKASMDFLVNMDPSWHDNLIVDDASPADLENATLQSYHDDPALLEREWYGSNGPAANKDEYRKKMECISKQTTEYVETLNNREALGVLYCPEIWQEYIKEYTAKDVCGESTMQNITCPCLFIGGEGGPASGNYETWVPALPKDTKCEVVMAKLVKLGLGGINAHGHSATYYKRHVLTVNKFFTKYVTNAGISSDQV